MSVLLVSIFLANSLTISISQDYPFRNISLTFEERVKVRILMNHYNIMNANIRMSKELPKV